jgi:hypothetical protein
MAHERFYELERRFRQLGEKIDDTSDAGELRQLNAEQADILSESLQIIRNLIQMEDLN